MITRDESPVELNISPEKVSFIIVKARAYDGKVAPVSPDDGSNATDDDLRMVAENAGDATAEELRGAILALNDSEVVDVIALAWLGRGDYDRTSWEEARALATERHKEDSSGYLMGIPLLGDYLEEGLSELGYPAPDLEG